jgi:hypothetical protein
MANLLHNTAARSERAAGRRATSRQKEKENPYRYKQKYQFVQYPMVVGREPAEADGKLGLAILANDRDEHADLLKQHGPDTIAPLPPLRTSEEALPRRPAARLAPEMQPEPEPAPSRGKSRGKVEAHESDAEDEVKRKNLLKIAKDLKIPGVKSSWTIEQLRAAIEG